MPRLVAITAGKIANIAWNVNEESSRAELDQALIDAWTAQYDNVAFIDDNTLRAEMNDDWNGARGVESLETLRTRKKTEINNKTETRIRAGYEFPPGSGQIFSMSDIAQFNLEVANNARDLSQLTYPLSFSFMDDSGAYDCPNATTLHAMWLTALALKRTMLDAGRTLKNAVAAATTLDEIDAIIDTR